MGEYKVVEMSGQPNVAPTIIKRKKVVSGDGHHGGAWKVAYADFVTAMMAFFMMMWLLNATTEKQRRGLADYFSPTIPVNRQSAGGDGMFSGDSMFAEDVLARNGTGASALSPVVGSQSSGAVGQAGTGMNTQDAANFQSIEEALFGRAGESMVSDDTLRHIVTRVTDEGFVIEIFDIENAVLFAENTTRPTRLLQEISGVIQRVTSLVTNDIAIAGHVRSNPVVRAENPVWSLSAQRADAMRLLLEGDGAAPERLRRVTGHADRSLSVADPLAVRNNRLEVILLRR